MRIGASSVALSSAYESPRVDSQKTRMRTWLGEPGSLPTAQTTRGTTRTYESDNEKKFDPAMLDWFVFLKSKHPDSDPMTGVEGVDEIRRLYKKAGPSYVAKPPAAKAAKPSAAPLDVVA